MLQQAIHLQYSYTTIRTWNLAGGSTLQLRSENLGRAIPIERSIISPYFMAPDVTAKLCIPKLVVELLLSFELLPCHISHV